MATETQSPDAIISSSGLNVSGGISVIQDDPNSPDGNWFTTTGSNGSLRVSFPTPTGDPTTGAGVQNFKCWLRKNASGGGDPTYVAELRETGGSSALQTLASGVAIASATGELETLTWDAVNLGTANGSAVELLLTFSKGGGGPNERNIEVGAIEWNVDYAVAADDLLANDVSSASSVGTPAIGQVHALTANDVSSASSVTTPALGQAHALLADDVSAASSVTAPALLEVVPLLAEDISSASSVGAPALGQEHALLADDVASASSVTTPAVGQAHALLADDVSSASSITVPALGQEHALLADDVASASSVTAPGLGSEEGDAPKTVGPTRHREHPKRGLVESYAPRSRSVSARIQRR